MLQPCTCFSWRPPHGDRDPAQRGSTCSKAFLRGFAELWVCYRTKVASACLHTVKPVCTTMSWWRKGQHLLQAQSKESRQLMLKRPKLPVGFQGKFSKTRWERGLQGDQLMDTLLIGWWWGDWASTSRTLWFQPVWGLCVCGRHLVNFLHLWGVSVSAKQLKEHGSE